MRKEHNSVIFSGARKVSSYGISSTDRIADGGGQSVLATVLYPDSSSRIAERSDAYV